MHVLLSVFAANVKDHVACVGTALQQSSFHRFKRARIQQGRAGHRVFIHSRERLLIKRCLPRCHTGAMAEGCWGITQPPLHAAGRRPGGTRGAVPHNSRGWRRLGTLAAAASAAGAVAVVAAVHLLGEGRGQPLSLTGLLEGGGAARVGGCEWKPEAELVGPCAGGMRAVSSKGASASAESCAAACCAAADACGAWQWRADRGCSHAADVRLGNEKDGPGAWCEPTAPARFAGQASDNFGADGAVECSDGGWQPAALYAQCFGLGDPRPAPAGASAAECRDACCAAAREARSPAPASSTHSNSGRGCRTWQWRADKGCFFSGRVFCRPPASEAELLPFRGRRKVIASRTYTPPAVQS